MSDLRERFQELADAAAREGRTPGAAAVIRRARQRQLHRAAGVASLLVVLLFAGTMLVDRVAGGPDEPGPRPVVGPPSTQPLPGTGKVRTDQPRAGTPEHRLLRNMTSALNRCRGGGDPQLIGWERAHGFVLMAAAKPPLPGEDWVCQVRGFLLPDGTGNVATERWVFEGLSPPPRKRLAASMSDLGLPADRGILAYVQGYATKQAARVRVLREGGRPPLEFGLVDPGDRFPVKFFLGLFAVPSAERFPVTAVQALDKAGRAIAQCTPGAPPVGDCRDTP
jgi:hypothetical protein